MSEQMQQKWSPVLDHPDLPAIKDKYRKAVTAVLLENQEKQAGQEAGGNMLFEAAPTMSMGASADASQGGTGNFKFADPVMISLVRRAMPQLIAYDVCGVQPMSGPTGLIFAMRAKLDNPSTGAEAFYGEPETAHSANSSGGTDAQVGTNPAAASEQNPENNFTAIAGMSGSSGETLGDGATNHFSEMAFAIDKVTVTAKSRALKGEYTMELAQDLKAVHGLDAETELSNILSTEILAEINREVIRTIYFNAQKGAATGTVATAGFFDMDVDSNGRWMVEKFKGLIFQIEREANQIAKNTRRGKGNIILTSSDVASALQMAGVLDYTPAMSADLNVDDTGNTFAGVLNGRYRVYVDPYATDAASPVGTDTTVTAGMQYFVVGYKGSSAYDAGLFYCPYVPLQMVRAVGENTFQPKIGFKTRYGMISNPFGNSAGDGGLTRDGNYYYRRVVVSNLM